MTDKPASQSGSASYWRKLASDLEVQVDIDALVPGAEKIGPVSAFVKGFGAKHGMIVVENYSQIDPWIDDLIGLGYGYSSFAADGDYCRADAIEMLQDWGWTGDAARPRWLG